MMKTRTVNKYIYEGLGVAVELHNVQMVFIDDEWHPMIDVKKVAKELIQKIPFQNERLTGNQVKFIRTYFEMSLRDFASKVVSESHAAVAKWEKTENNPTKMDLNIEVMLRLYIIDHESVRTKKQKSEFHDSYRKLREMDFSLKSPSLVLAM